MDNFRFITELVSVAKVGQGQSKSKDCGDSVTSAILPNMNVLGQDISILELENRNGGEAF